MAQFIVCDLEEDFKVSLRRLAESSRSQSARGNAAHLTQRRQGIHTANDVAWLAYFGTIQRRRLDVRSARVAWPRYTLG